jgi:molecular chaperone GrpE
MKQDTAGDDVTAREPEEAAAGSAGSAPEDAAVSALEAERDELKDLLLRKQAEFENFRKRTERERAEFVQFALGDCMTELLNVLDSFELALKDRGSDEASRGVHRGYELIYKQLAESLQRFGLEAVDASGQVFDPHVHQAVSTEPTAEVDEGMVLQELRKGYLLKGRLLRPAMVTVAAPPEKDDGSGE